MFKPKTPAKVHELPPTNNEQQTTACPELAEGNNEQRTILN
jgi:hypothetical protein